MSFGVVLRGRTAWRRVLSSSSPSGGGHGGSGTWKPSSSSAPSTSSLTERSRALIERLFCDSLDTSCLRTSSPHASPGTVTALRSRFGRWGVDLAGRWARAAECAQGTSFWAPTSAARLAESEQRLLEATVRSPWKHRESETGVKGGGGINSIEVNAENTAAAAVAKNSNGKDSERTDVFGQFHTAGTTSSSTPGGRPAIVIAHGFGSGLALHALQFDPLVQPFGRLLAFDWPGFGRSRRDEPFTGEGPEDAERYFLDRFNAWLDRAGIDDFVLVGHSMGGYLAACEALSRNHQHHQGSPAAAAGGAGKLRGLVLLSPFGMQPPPPSGFVPLSSRAPRPLRGLVQRIEGREMSGQSVLRALGPLGPRIMRTARRGFAPGFARRFAELEAAGGEKAGRGRDTGSSGGATRAHLNRAVDLLGAYAFHTNAQPRSWESGERAFAHLTEAISYASRPLVPRIKEAGGLGVPALFLYGDRDWMDPAPAVRLVSECDGIETAIVPSAGHNLMIDHAKATNDAITEWSRRMGFV